MVNVKNFVDHVELPALDLEKSKKFFESVFDWNVNLEMMPNYGFVQSKPSVGLFKVEKIDSGATKTNVVIHVEDIESHLKKVKKFGGSVVKGKTAIGEGFGFYAQFLTPDGFEMGMAQDPEES